MIGLAGDRAPTAADREDWCAANEACNALGFAWLDRRLAGEAAIEARAAWHAARDDMAGTPCALDRLSQLFELAPFDEDVLLVALAFAHDGSFGVRFAAAQGRAGACPPTPHLLALLLFNSHALPAAALQRLAGTAPLRRFALLAADAPGTPGSGDGLTLPPRLHAALCGIDDGDPGLDGIISRRAAVPLPDRMAALATRLAAAAGTPLRLQVIGPGSSGRTALATAIFDRIGLGTLHTAAALPPACAAAAGRDAIIDQCGLVVDLATTAPATAAQLDALPSVPLILVAETATPALPHIAIARLAPMDAAERAALWQASLPGVAPDEARAAAEQFGLGPGAIAAIARQPGLSGRGLWAACRDLGAHDLEALTTRITPRRSWDDIVLADATRAELAVLVEQVRQRPLVHGDWGYGRILGRAAGISALFAGPSGTGKTLAAEVVAEALQLDLNIVDLSQVTSKYIGETEKNLRRIFDAAEAGGAVLFFDEADALFGKRSDVKDSHDRYANAEVSYLLQRIESYGGLAILATNLKAHLDTAFLRRLRMIIDFPLPDVATRRMLWQRALPGSAPCRDIDLAELARLDLTGGNITTIAANAAARAAMDGGIITMPHLRSAIAAEFRKLDRDASGLA
jgi:hypothetical protein